jgi:hypothetical protein
MTSVFGRSKHSPEYLRRPYSLTFNSLGFDIRTTEICSQMLSVARRDMLTSISV